MSGFEKLLYRLLNRFVGLVLRSPLHESLSGRVLLLTFSGRRSGRSITVPLGYVREDRSLVCFTGAGWSVWWKNLRGGAPVAVRVGGRDKTGYAEAKSEGPEVIAGLEAFLRTFPRTAARYGVALGADGLPDPADIEAAVRGGRVVMVSIRPQKGYLAGDGSAEPTPVTRSSR